MAVEWVAARSLVPALQGPVVDFRTFFSRRGIVLNYDLPGQPARRNASASTTSSATLEPAAGWTNVPASYSPARSSVFTHDDVRGRSQAGVFDLYIYDSTNDGATNYDRVLIVNATAAKDGAAALANLAHGHWEDAKVTLVGTLAGQTAGFHTKLIDLNADVSQFRLYFTSSGARTRRTTRSGRPARPRSKRRWPTTSRPRPRPTSRRSRRCIVDEDTYVEQGLMWEDAHWAYLNYIFSTLGVKPDLLLLGTRSRTSSATSSWGC